MDICERFATDLYDIGVIKCGSFKLKTGMMVPVYFDFRVLVSYPKVLQRLSVEIAQRISTEFGRDSFDVVCGVPYTALPFSVLAAQQLGAPLVVKRKEAKNYGTMTLIDGKFKPGDRCIIIEDTVTSGTSIVEVVHAVEAAGLRVVGVVALLDREQGGASNLAQAGLSCTFLFKASDLLTALQNTGHLDPKLVDSAIQFLHNNRVQLEAPKTEPTNDKENGGAGSKELSPDAKPSDLIGTPAVSVGRRLFDIIRNKKTNLCLSADVETCKELIELADIVGPHICALKTHVDLLNDEFDHASEKKLVELAKKHNFIIIEDRKLADIGNTSRRIFARICRWADMVTVHALPGTEQVRAMSTALPNKSCGILLVAQMSCDGNLINDVYTKACTDMARQFPGFVAGVVAQNAKGINGLPSGNNFAVFTPGVSLDSKGDSAGQRYTTPEEAVRDRGTDVIIVGRGILDSYTDTKSAAATVASAEKYRAAAFEPYQAHNSWKLG